MVNVQKHIITGLIIASVVLFVSALVWLYRRKRRERYAPEKHSKTGMSTTLVFTIFLIFTIWCFKFAIGFFEIVFSDPETLTLAWGEEIVNTFFTSLRTFSMSEDYAKYILDVKELVSKIVPVAHWSLPYVKAAAVIYATLLNLIAPIAGGAMILEIITGVFPKVKLLMAYCNVRRKKYFFSELSASSLALAKSISATKKKEKPILIFTDTHIDDEKEKDYELLLEAKRYGAICVRDDLAHVIKPTHGKSEFYLMDENEFGNLQTLMGLVEDHNIKFVKNSYIYLFVQSDAYVQIEKQVNSDLDSERKKKLLKRGEKPTIIPVNGYRNLVHNLLVDIPLYEPLVEKDNPENLNVTILGNGIIGTEAFLSTYWFGQMMVSGEQNGRKTMTECDVTINVVSKDTEEEFWSKIDYINPEIKDTVKVLGASSDGSESELLIYNGKGEKNKPYCNVRYIHADVKIGGFWNGEVEKTRELLNSDYIIVALGNDADNISVAEKLRRSIGKKHLEIASDKCVRNTVIAYAVFDSKIVNTLNRQKRYKKFETGNADIYMHAFGSLEQVYSCDNVYMSKNSLQAKEANNAYSEAQMKSHIEDNQSRAKGGEDGNYKYWANMAKASHIKYKIFSLGWIKRSIFSFYGDEIKCRIDETKMGTGRYDILPEKFDKECDRVSADIYHREFTEQICKKYKHIAVSNGESFADAESQELKNDLELKKHCLAWLEHRRWNAFTRSMGYQCTEINNILEVKNSQKDMQLKLHACLVEAKRPMLESGDVYMNVQFMANGKVDTDTAFKSDPEDYLDDVSYARRKRDVTKTSDDFKMYDYYRYEFDDYLNAEEAAKLINVDKETLVSNCRKGKLNGAILFDGCPEWYIPKNELENFKK